MLFLWQKPAPLLQALEPESLVNTIEISAEKPKPVVSQTRILSPTVVQSAPRKAVLQPTREFENSQKAMKKDAVAGQLPGQQQLQATTRTTQLATPSHHENAGHSKPNPNTNVYRHDTTQTPSSFMERVYQEKQKYDKSKSETSSCGFYYHRQFLCCRSKTLSWLYFHPDTSLIKHMRVVKKSIKESVTSHAFTHTDSHPIDLVLEQDPLEDVMDDIEQDDYCESQQLVDIDEYEEACSRSMNMELDAPLVINDSISKVLPEPPSESDMKPWLSVETFSVSDSLLSSRSNTASVDLSIPRANDSASSTFINTTLVPLPSDDTHNQPKMDHASDSHCLERESKKLKLAEETTQEFIDAQRYSVGSSMQQPTQTDEPPLLSSLFHHDLDQPSQDQPFTGTRCHSESPEPKEPSQMADFESFLANDLDLLKEIK